MFGGIEELMTFSDLQLGISIVYLLDYVMGASWWLMIIYVIEIAAVLIVRGRPYSGESIVAVLVKGSGCMANWCNPLLSFSWSVVLPIGLLVVLPPFLPAPLRFTHFSDKKLSHGLITRKTFVRVPAPRIRSDFSKVAPFREVKRVFNLRVETGLFQKGNFLDSTKIYVVTVHLAFCSPRSIYFYS